MTGAITSSGYRCVPPAALVGEYTTVLFCDTPDVHDTPSLGVA